MKRILFSLLGLISLAASAQTASEVIEKYNAGMGGISAFNAVKSATMTGTVTAQGMDLPFTKIVVNGHAMRTDVEVMGQKITNSYKDGSAWKINPYAGAESKTEVTGNELAEFKTQATLINPLMNYKEGGHKVELLPAVSVEGVNCLPIKLTMAGDSKIITYYISSTDYLLVKSVTVKNLQGQDTEVETYYSNFKDYGGMKFCMSMSQKINGQEFQAINLEKVELNSTVDNKIFEN